MNEFDLKDMIERRFGNVRAFAQEADIPYTTMRSILERGLMNAKAENVFKICSTLHISPEDLVPINYTKPTTPTDSPIITDIIDTIRQIESDERQSVVLATAKTQLAEEQAEQVQETLYPYYVLEKLSAGTGYSYTEDRTADVVYWTKEIAYDFASWVFGDSMEPDYPDGTVALIQGTGFDYDGETYAVDWDGQSYIKRVYKEPDGLRLVSTNPKYADKFARWEEGPRVIGKVIADFKPIDL